MHSVRSRGGQHTSLSARRDAGFIDPNRLARRRTKPGDAGPSCEGVPTGGIASPGRQAPSWRIRSESAEMLKVTFNKEQRCWSK